MLYKLKPVDAMQVPVPVEHEAAKDLEARFAKLCAWLDEKGMLEIDFTLPRPSHDAGMPDVPGSVTFTDVKDTNVYTRRELLPASFVEGFWLIWNPQMERFMVWPNETFTALYELY